MDPRPDAWLDAIRIGSPCDERWEDMPGDERARACARCELQVFNLAGMSRTEAAALIGGADGRVCARIVRRPDGTVLTRDCPVALARLRRRAALMVAGLLGMFAAAAGLVMAAVQRDRGGWGDGWAHRLPDALRPVVEPSAEPEVVMMGSVCAPTVPVTPPAPGGR
jgi:hypothetical protein